MVSFIPHCSDNKRDIKSSIWGDLPYFAHNHLIWAANNIDIKILSPPNHPNSTPRAVVNVLCNYFSWENSCYRHVSNKPSRLTLFTERNLFKSSYLLWLLSPLMFQLIMLISGGFPYIVTSICLIQSCKCIWTFCDFYPSMLWVMPCCWWCFSTWDLYKSLLVCFLSDRLMCDSLIYNSMLNWPPNLHNPLLLSTVLHIVPKEITMSAFDSSPFIPNFPLH